jgi:hypothetical protein
MNNLVKPVPNSFPDLGRDLYQRIRTPLGSPTYWNNLIWGVIIFGGIAIWIEFLKYGFNLPGTHPAQGIRTAFNTYFAAVGCGSALQLITAEKDNQDLRSFGYAASFSFFSVCILTLLLQINHPYLSLIVGIAFSVLAVLMWSIANGLDGAYSRITPDASLGGSVEDRLRGTTSGFKV